MTKRERYLLFGVLTIGGVIILAGGVLGVGNVHEELDQKDKQIDDLRREIIVHKDKVAKLTGAQAKLRQWRTFSLPPDPSTSNLLYRQFLQDLCWRYGLDVRQMTSASAGPLRAAPGPTTNLMSPLAYQVQLEGTLAQLVNFLKEFHATPFPHQIREISISPRGSSARARLEMTLRIEALQLPNAEAREFLLPVPDPRLLCVETLTALQQGPAGLALGPWLVNPAGPRLGRKLAAHVTPSRDYARLESKNIFVGLAAPASGPAGSAATAKLDYIQVTSIISGPTTTVASLRNHRTNQKIVLRLESGFDTLEIRAPTGHIILKAKVKAVNQRKLLFQEGETYSIVRVGQFLSERQEKEDLSDADLEEFHLLQAASGK